MEEIVKLNNLTEAIKDKIESIRIEHQNKLNKIEKSVVNIINNIYKWGYSSHWYINKDTKDNLGKELNQKIQIIEEVGDEIHLSQWYVVCGEYRVSQIKIFQFNENEIGTILYALDDNMTPIKIYYQLMHND